MARERQGHTLQATALVNEAYLRLIDIRAISWRDRSHFLAMSARMMRRILVDSARARKYDKRGGGAENVPWDEAMLVPIESGHGLGALDDALKALEAVHPRKSQVVEMRFFGGMTIDETATALDISTETVNRDWRFAKLWLLRELESHA
jgi:RNA polymerase sigma factor (TIGR02999 family)